MKLRVEIAPEQPDEVIIRCSSITDEVRRLQDVVNNVVQSNAELTVYSGDTEYYLPRGDILFFETDGGKTTAHTAQGMYYTGYRLRELEQMLPLAFVRASKSCIVNAAHISSIKKNIAGASEVAFRGSHKKVYVSRMYFKVFYERVNESRALSPKG